MRIPAWMAHAIRNPAFGLALTLVGLALPWPLPFAAAQSNLFDLNGTWELEDRGVLDQDKPARVRITQKGQSVRGEFISGAACFDKKVRPYAIDGVLSVSAATPERLSLSGATMWACSGTPSLVEECGNRISSMYQTTVSNVSLSHDLITGDRARQEVLNCVGRPSSETTRFTLRRIPPCEDAERTVTRLEETLQKILRDLVGRARTFIPNFTDGARQRFGPIYKGPTSSGSLQTFDALYILLHQPSETSLATTEAFWEAWPGYLASDAWMKVHEMTADMALMAQPPFLPAQEMLIELNRIEETGKDGLGYRERLRDARQYLDLCRRTHYPPVP